MQIVKKKIKDHKLKTEKQMLILWMGVNKRIKEAKMAIKLKEKQIKSQILSNWFKFAATEKMIGNLTRQEERRQTLIMWNKYLEKRKQNTLELEKIKEHKLKLKKHILASYLKTTEKS
jgi:hypothetical protein